MLKHFLTVADNSSIPIIIYNVPAFTGFDIPISAIETLAEHENIIGIKESSGDIVKISQIVSTIKRVKHY